MAQAQLESGSFRDPSGRVYAIGERVFRTVMPCAVNDFEFVRSTELFEQLVKSDLLIAETTVTPDIIGEFSTGARYVLEHPKLNFISYPYEWSFSALKSAALLQLDLYLKALEFGVTLSDASAYNIQFRGCKPVFIDTLSFRRYRDGEFWLAHRQFCEQFLNPLLLRAMMGIAHNAWYRGSLEGIPTQDLNRLLSWKHKLSWNTIAHVVLQSGLQTKYAQDDNTREKVKQKKFPLVAFKHMLHGLRKWIAKLEPANTGKSEWGNYAQNNSYSTEESRTKKSFIREYIRAVKPQILWDIGCNNGEYSSVALSEGTQFAVGFDFDQDALDAAFSRARNEQLNFLPLFLDAANPAPNQGWRQTERKGLAQRASADGVIALAVIHHLAIGRNIPLDETVDWLANMAPQGVIEFIPKNDPMVQTLLRFRDDIFENYTQETFEQALKSRAEIVRSEVVTNSQRRLYWFKRRSK